MKWFIKFYYILDSEIILKLIEVKFSKKFVFEEWKNLNDFNKENLTKDDIKDASQMGKNELVIKR